MNILDKAISEFWRNEGKMPVIIYIGHNILIQVRLTDYYMILDMANTRYSGIPFQRVSSDPDHLALY